MISYRVAAKLKFHKEQSISQQKCTTHQASKPMLTSLVLRLFCNLTTLTAPNRSFAGKARSHSLGTGCSQLALVQPFPLCINGKTVCFKCSNGTIFVYCHQHR
ncbi:RIKEN cDNA 4921522P10 [Mus musculus]|uniref:Uncharacterized protein n=1 Tax=Mus musculus TaxID=10090 RepID=Q9D5T6_MOUSE|nr:RIKEN cDNA 4921522P10 [Mus musculus]BAB29634.1 unnamed protein product [Mus musculus]